jgi:L-2,4-diaminobutyrate decarboxylase
LAEHPEFEPACEPPLSAICIRYRGADPDQAASRELHAEVAKRVEQSGKFWFATTELKGKMYFRISPVNFRTRMEHMDQLLAFLELECVSVLQEQSADRSSALSR